MLHSQMTEQQKQQFERPESFPMRVRFLGKIGTLTFEEVRFLREQGVDFEVGEPTRERGFFSQLISLAGALSLGVLAWRQRRKRR